MRVHGNITIDVTWSPKVSQIGPPGPVTETGHAHFTFSAIVPFAGGTVDVAPIAEMTGLAGSSELLLGQRLFFINTDEFGTGLEDLLFTNIACV